jgi:hypothetical protein
LTSCGALSNWNRSALPARVQVFHHLRWVF